MIIPTPGSFLVLEIWGQSYCLNFLWLLLACFSICPFLHSFWSDELQSHFCGHSLEQNALKAERRCSLGERISAHDSEYTVWLAQQGGVCFWPATFPVFHHLFLMLLLIHIEFAALVARDKACTPEQSWGDGAKGKQTEKAAVRRHLRWDQ